LAVAVPITSGGVVLGAVGISTSADEVDESVAAFRWKLTAIAAGALVLAAAVAWFLSGWVTRPIRRLEQVASRVGAGELSARASTDAGPSEVRSLGREFNATVGRLEELVRAQDAFVGDASHQLRTPLTALRLRLENGDVSGALGETERLSRIVDALLALARAEGCPAETVELAAAVAERIDAWSPVAEAQGIRLETDVVGRAVVGRDRLTQVLDNLVANAVVASPPGSVVVIHGDARALHVRDHGPGMTADDRARAFDRFWSKSSGSGLGLPIAKRLVEVDGGSVELQAATDGGLDVVLHLAGITG
jgi:signal transduction histidine kinase